MQYCGVKWKSFHYQSDKRLCRSQKTRVSYYCIPWWSPQGNDTRRHSRQWPTQYNSRTSTGSAGSLHCTYLQLHHTATGTSVDWPITVFAFTELCCAKMLAIATKHSLPSKYIRNKLFPKCSELMLTFATIVLHVSFSINQSINCISDSQTFFPVSMASGGTTNPMDYKYGFNDPGFL